MGNRSTLAVLTAVGFLVGGTAGWQIHAIRAKRHERLLGAIQAVGVAGLCATALNATQEGRVPTAQKILEMRMVGAVEQADEEVGNASSPDQPIPNLIEGLKRARSYAAQKGMTKLAGKCDHVLEFLAKGNRV